MSRFLAKGFVATRASVGRLNSMVVDVLVKHGLKAVGMGSCGYLWTSEKKLPWYTAWGHVLYEGLSGLLNAGIIPVMHGDCVLDDKQVCTILSGDTIFYWMCRAFKPSRGIFLTDVAGIFDKPPTEEGARLIPRISARGDVKSSIETCVPAHDVTGGIKTKLASAVKVAGELGIPVYIVQAGTPSALQAMEGREPEFFSNVYKYSRLSFKLHWSPHAPFYSDMIATIEEPNVEGVVKYEPAAECEVDQLGFVPTCSVSNTVNIEDTLKKPVGVTLIGAVKRRAVEESEFDDVSCGTIDVASSSDDEPAAPSLCRAATSAKSLPTAGFRPEQVTFEGPMKEVYPDGSTNSQDDYETYALPTAPKPLYCGECSEYIAGGAVNTLGMFTLPTSEDADCEYLPTMHIFYENRVEDVEDPLPKWSALPCASNGLMEPSTEPLLWRDVRPLGPSRPPYPQTYTFSQMSDLPPNYETGTLTEEKQEARIKSKYAAPRNETPTFVEKEYDIIIVGGGHNGLITAAYLAKEGYDVLVLERRHVVGGAAVTEELFPGYKYSRCSYLAGLLNPEIIKDLDLTREWTGGFKYLLRDPGSVTPTPMSHPIYRGRDARLPVFIDSFNTQSQSLVVVILTSWATSDAVVFYIKRYRYHAQAALDRGMLMCFPLYEQLLKEMREVLEPLMQGCPMRPSDAKSIPEFVNHSLRIMKTLKRLTKHSDAVPDLYELFTAPASQILDRWFETDVLKGYTGDRCCYRQHGESGGLRKCLRKVLLHHVLGNVNGRQGVWAYVEGGMGRISSAIAERAMQAGAVIMTDAQVQRITHDGTRATGVEMSDGTQLRARMCVVSNATPWHTFLELLPLNACDRPKSLGDRFTSQIRFTDYSCGAMKINCAVDRLPQIPGVAPEHLQGTVHFETSLGQIEVAAHEARSGIPATRPVVEMTLPSILDSSLVPYNSGHHICQLFVQYAPYDVSPNHGSWADPGFVERFVERVFDVIHEHDPDFANSVLHKDVITPLTLEHEFGLHKGNIFHGALQLHQLGYTRPQARTPLDGLYLCGAGAHPGGGVMGTPGKNAAQVILWDLAKKERK
ncbi:Pyridine nucleotide-disulfide oxidoreductase domain-containing protein 2 [Perkinsus olseni]|uniref:Pyridine nucleotide-disulfide oxidoreductase domain-containing protein 2 n=1 Tax=Perkinsus olseni TaxID=32597 RepID=A0A7J6P5T9_PEROL|nr:Pyridine nucleotide-disulfide oxidoreductase domain-containing protein 2 [Perkinsus olseni]